MSDYMNMAKINTVKHDKEEKKEYNILAEKQQNKDDDDMPEQGTPTKVGDKNKMKLEDSMRLALEERRQFMHSQVNDPTKKIETGIDIEGFVPEKKKNAMFNS